MIHKNRWKNGSFPDCFPAAVKYRSLPYGSTTFLKKLPRDNTSIPLFRKKARRSCEVFYNLMFFVYFFVHFCLSAPDSCFFGAVFAKKRLGKCSFHSRRMKKNIFFAKKMKDEQYFFAERTRFCSFSRWKCRKMNVIFLLKLFQKCQLLLVRQTIR